MTRRKLVGAAFFFSLFGAIALLPPVVLVASFDGRVFGIPVESVYLFVLWALLIAGARWFSRVLPHDEPPRTGQSDGEP